MRKLVDKVFVFKIVSPFPSAVENSITKSFNLLVPRGLKIAQPLQKTSPFPPRIFLFYSIVRAVSHSE
jgi:hypothetical protein